MSYTSQTQQAGRRPISVAILTLDKCANTYGVGPCTASGAAGSECFNTFGTCQDPPNYDGSDTIDVVLTGAKDDIFTPGNVADTAAPCIESLSIAPEKITPGKGLGYRGKVSLNCLDFPHHDINLDPYVATRSYTPISQGSFFGKMLARNKHYVNRPLKIRQYFYDGGRTPAHYRELFYIIDRIDLANGKATITGKDPLILAEASKAQCPAESTGTLSADLAAATTSTFDLNTGEGDDYPTGAHILRINDELISISSRTGDTFTIDSRAYGGSTADDHTAADVVQLCYVRDGTASDRVDLVLADLLENYAAMPSAYLPTADWSTEAATWAPGYHLETIISEPTAVNELLSEICIETNSVMWWSPSEQLIKWEMQTPSFATLETLTDRDTIENMTKVKFLEKERVSRVLYYSDVRNWAEDLKAVNYRALTVRLDATSESDDGYQSPGTKKIFARWMQNNSINGEVASRYLARFKNPPEQITTELDLKDITTLITGDHINITTSALQDETGAADTIEAQVLSVQPYRDKLKVEAMRFRYDQQNYCKVGADTMGDYTAETGANQFIYGFIADTTTEQFSNGDDPNLIL